MLEANQLYQKLLDNKPTEKQLEASKESLAQGYLVKAREYNDKQQWQKAVTSATTGIKFGSSGQCTAQLENVKKKALQQLENIKRLAVESAARQEYIQSTANDLIRATRNRKSGHTK